MQDLKEKFKSILSLPIPEAKQKAKTFLEIAKMPHYENVDSNILSFFLDKDEEHQLQDLFLQSLIQILESKIIEGSKDLNFIDWTVEREVITDTGTRIDLVIRSTGGDKVIIIENKIYHWLANDLESYWAQFPDVQGENRIGVVLSLEQVDTKNVNFINITHRDLNQAILKNLHNYYLEANDKHLIFLKDYIENKNRFYMNSSDKDQLLFYFENSEKIDELAQIKQKSFDYIYTQIEKVGKDLDFTPYGRVNKGRYYLFKETKVLYFAIFPNEIFSKNPEYKIILETHNVSKEVQQLLINHLNTLEVESRDISILREPTARPHAHLAHKIYPFSPNNIESFYEILMKNIKEDFIPLKNEVLPLFLKELGK